MGPRESFHMTPEEFRRHGRAVVDWIADYWERVERLPVLSMVQPGDILAALPASPPIDGEPFEALLHDIDSVILSGLTPGNRPTSSRSSRPTRRVRPSLASSSRPASVCRGCSG